MTRSFSFESDKYGILEIWEQKDGSWNIGWDYECICESQLLEPDMSIYDEMKDIDISDAPKDGRFESFDAAKKYLNSKFGELK